VFITPVVLWTDACLFFLMTMVGGLLFYLHRYTLFGTQLVTVYQRPFHAIMMVVLLLYGLVGFLDSLHFKKDKDTRVVSVLDVLVAPLRVMETTYSAPFATHGYVKKSYRDADGVVRWHEPRLQHGGAHLNNPAVEKWPDVRQKALGGLYNGVGVWCVLFAVFVLLVAFKDRVSAWVSLKRLLLGEMKSPWRTVWATLLVVLAGVGLCEAWMGYYHIFGTDKVGEDVFYMAIKSIRTGLVIGSLTLVIMLPFAVFFGTVAGYFGGWVDDVIQYVYTTVSSVPGVLLIVASMLSLQVFMDKQAVAFGSMLERADLRLFLLCFVLGVTSWTGLCRLLRGETLKLRELAFVQAARALGVGSFGIIRRHIVPNLMHIILISVALDFSGLILAESILSYIGVGVDPASFSWGNMINASRLEMAREPVVWWTLTGAFFMMFFLVLAANLFADALRDALDPRRYR